MKVVYITGSTGRLGSFLAEGFINAGFSVVGLDLDHTKTTTWPLLEMDVTDEASVENGFKQAVTSFGAPDIVIHTVGMWAMSPFSETTLDSWNTLVSLNLTSSFLVFKHAILSMSGLGSLIGISSKQGVVKGAAEQAGYSASKGGLVRMVEAIAEEYRGRGIHAHIVAPSTILYEDDQKGGVRVADLVAHCLYLSSTQAASLSGSVLSAFGDG